MVSECEPLLHVLIGGVYQGVVLDICCVELPRASALKGVNVTPQALEACNSCVLAHVALRSCWWWV
jgi:hypothetical protein